MPVEAILGFAVIGALAVLIVLMEPPTGVRRMPVHRTVGLSREQLRAMQRAQAAPGAGLVVARGSGTWDGVERRKSGIRSPKLDPRTVDATRHATPAGLVAGTRRAS